tara:strand:- start:389 stop:913 length:525 start_codon:yes stop_codon:yes gene_type:complete
MNNCYKTSNNKYFNCPARMSDARHFTNYNPSCELNAMIKLDNKLNNSFEFRQFLQANATKLMDVNKQHSCKLNCCNLEEGFTDTMLPAQNTVTCDKKTCHKQQTNPNGLGDTKNYFTENRAEPCDNLPPHWPVASQDTNSCIIPLDHYYYLGDSNNQKSILRNAHPLGGNSLCN